MTMGSNVRPLVQVVSSPQFKRTMRRPVHTFNLRHIPFAITPCFIAPVWPGESMKDLMLQARVVTDPISNPLIGWWHEYYVFYVKLRDLAERDNIVTMLLDPTSTGTTARNAIATSAGTSAKPYNYFAAGSGQIDWVELCRRRVVQEFFRDEGDTYSDYTVTDASVAHSMAQFVGNNVLDSVFDAGDTAAVDVTVVNESGSDTVTASEIDNAMRLWQAQRMNTLVDMSFEDWLATYGVRPPSVELHRPELIRYVKEWQYPSNTIDPTNGTPRSAVSWSIRERADKTRFFKEPGFIFGLTVTRPKVYLANQVGTFTAAMNDYKSWLPAVFASDPMTSLVQIADNVGPLTVSTDTAGYWVDIKDLALHGEQFVNFALTGLVNNLMPVPTADLLNKRYPTALDDIRNLFVDETGGGGAYYVRQDGVVALQIASDLQETTPRGGPVSVA